MQCGLVAVEQDELAGSEAVHLPRQLRADGAAGAGDQDAAPGQVVGDPPEVGVDRVPAEHVGDVDLADAVELDPAADHLRDGRQRQELQAGMVDLVLQLADEATRRGGDGEDDGVGLEVVGGADQRRLDRRRPGCRAGAGGAWQGCRR